MPKPSDLIPDALKGMLDPKDLAAMDQEALDAEQKQKIRDDVIAQLVLEVGKLTDDVNLIKTKVGV